MIINVKTEEETLAANNNVTLAKVVRLYNSNASDTLIVRQTAAGANVGSFTVQGNTVVLVEKDATDELYANSNGGDVLVTNIAYSVS